MIAGACSYAPHSCNPYPPKTRHIPECDGPTRSPFYRQCGAAQVIWPGGPTEDDALTVANLAIARNDCVSADIQRDRGVLIIVGTGCR